MLWDELFVCQVFLPRVQVNLQASTESVFVDDPIVLAVKFAVPYNPIDHVCLS